jgi:hypothetical protein
MSLPKEEIDKLKCVFASEEKPLSGRAIRQLVPYLSTRLCETGFSNYAGRKTKYRTRPYLRIKRCGIEPSVNMICEERKKTTLRIKN